ncbi:hypothetical protein KIW84_UN0901 [Lathyrus oleraceus]|nr:hypothetical protein KIW84_UN0901 [Pisum sativum]
MIAMVNALNQAGSMLHQSTTNHGPRSRTKEARPQPVSRIQQRPEPTKSEDVALPNPTPAGHAPHRDGGRARTSPRRGHSPEQRTVSLKERRGRFALPPISGNNGSPAPQRHGETAKPSYTTEHMKKYLLERGLLPGSELSRAVGIEPPRTLNELLHKAQAYIRYEEKQVAHNARSGRNAGETEHSKREDTSISRRNGDRRREERPRELPGGRGPAGRYSEYTLLTAPRERILAECINSEFKQGRVRGAPEAVHEEDEAPRRRARRRRDPGKHTPRQLSLSSGPLRVTTEDFCLPEPLPEARSLHSAPGKTSLPHW